MPLFNSASDLPFGASRRVTAPGGYEWWQVEAEDVDADLRVVATLSLGSPFNPTYLRDYRRYRAAPTRHAPPQPADAPGGYCCVYRAGRPVAQCNLAFAPQDFAASPTHLDVAAPGSRLNVEPDGTLSLRLRGPAWRHGWFGPAVSATDTLDVDLSLTPTSGAAASPSVALPLIGNHRWTVCGGGGPMVARGTIRLPGTADASPSDLRLNGLGCAEHHFGDAPLADEVACWVRGRVLTKERAWHLYVIQPAKGPAHGSTIAQNMAGTTEIVQESVSEIAWSGLTRWGLRHPTRIRTSRSQGRTNPVVDAAKVIDSTPCFLRIECQVSLAWGERETGVCGLGYPRRVGWPPIAAMLSRTVARPGGPSLAGAENRTERTPSPHDNPRPS